MPTIIGASTSPKRATVAAGASGWVVPARTPWSLSVQPAEGATALVEVTVSPPSLFGTDGAGASWQTLESGVVAARVYGFETPVTAVRISATGAAVTVEATP